MPLANDIIKSIRKEVGKQKHHLHEPLFFGNEIKYLKKTITTNLVSSVGPFVKWFENQITKFTRSKYTISVVNCTEALHLSFFGIKRFRFHMMMKKFLAPPFFYPFCLKIFASF